MLLTVDYFHEWEKWEEWRRIKPRPWLPLKNIHLKALVGGSGFVPMAPRLCDPIPPDARVSDEWLRSIGVVRSRHVAPELEVSAIGMSLIKPYRECDMGSARFVLLRSWLRRRKDGSINAFRTWAHGGEWQSTPFWLPEELFAPGPLSGEAVAAAFGVGHGTAALLVTELIGEGILREYDGECDDAYWSSVGDDESLQVRYPVSTDEVRRTMA
jgi:hypothetical protein